VYNAVRVEPGPDFVTANSLPTLVMAGLDPAKSGFGADPRIALG